MLHASICSSVSRVSCNESLECARLPLDVTFTVGRSAVDILGLRSPARATQCTARSPCVDIPGVPSLNPSASRLQKRYALQFLRTRSAESSSPFFLLVAPPAPHAPQTPAPQHARLFPEVRAPRTASYNTVAQVSQSLTPRSGIVTSPRYRDVIEEIGEMNRD